jgi:hypothetical protein
MTAREHAIVASQLLENLGAATDRMRERLRDPMGQVEAVAHGLIHQHNADAQYTPEVARAHALAALALTATGGGEP